MDPLSQYLQDVQKTYAAKNATEHSYRAFLQTLLQAQMAGVVATNEPKRIACGAPDYVLNKGQTPLGYVEAKDIGVNLDKEENSEQMRRYRPSLGNLILTDYLDFRWFVGGQKRLEARLAAPGAGHTLKGVAGGAEKVQELLSAFLNAEVPTVGSPRELAGRMANIAKLLKKTLRSALDQEDKGGSLHAQMVAFKASLLHDLNEDEFADMYAQTICYGLFAARVNAPTGQNFTRILAPHELPRTNPFLRDVFGYIVGPNLDTRLTWAVDDLAELLNRADMSAILADFGHRTRQEDPVVHFYETFLAAYDPKMREARGVYYTPEPVVSYIVRSVDALLKRDFGLSDGLADEAKIAGTDSPKVQILDPATGTGTFLHGVIDKIAEGFVGRQGDWSDYVRLHLLPRLFGFELLVAPYTVAHMKLGLQLGEYGYKFDTDERLRVYLTNTLEEAGTLSGATLFAQEVAKEANAASGIKTEAPVMVVLGNPPYSVASQNRGAWIVELLDDYKKDLGEKKLNLDDDFIKFIKFAQWRIEKTGHGIVAYITNNTYLDGITHRRMRESLMETFDDIYILDLHGSTKKKENEGPDKPPFNVFDIQQGVAISLFVKKPGPHKGCTVRHAELWGGRAGKYKTLLETDVLSTKWEPIQNIDQESCLGQFFFFKPKAFDNIEEYCEGWGVKDIFLVSGSGVKTDRDSLFVDDDKSALAARMQKFYSPDGILSPFIEEYNVTNSSSYDLLKRRTNTEYDAANIHRFLYRPFDARWIYYAPGLTSRPAFDVMQHIIAGDNIAFCTLRQSRRDEEGAFFAANGLIGKDIVSIFDIATVFPLYFTAASVATHLFDADTPDAARRPNLAPGFIADMEKRLGMAFVPDGTGDLVATFGPEDVFHYAYAVFHSPTYRSRYAEFLKIDFPRLPLTANAALFRQLCALGTQLVAAHLLTHTQAPKPTFPVPGDNAVTGVRYVAPGEGDGAGRVFINASQYFLGVPPDVWEFQVGGYQVCHKFLKDRKERPLTYDERKTYAQMVSALADTLRLMAAVDAALDAAGGWPIS